MLKCTSGTAIVTFLPTLVHILGKNSSYHSGPRETPWKLPFPFLSFYFRPWSYQDVQSGEGELEFKGRGLRSKAFLSTMLDCFPEERVVMGRLKRRAMTLVPSW